jgi:hypothetical protein
VGTSVATMTLVPRGAQQWMCAIVAGAVKLLKLPLIVSVSATVSNTTVTLPVPGTLRGGTSFAPERLAPNVRVAAFTAGTDSISAAVIKNKVDKGYRMGHSTKWHPPNPQMTNL